MILVSSQPDCLSIHILCRLLVSIFMHLHLHPPRIPLDPPRATPSPIPSRARCESRSRLSRRAQNDATWLFRPAREAAGRWSSSRYSISLRQCYTDVIGLTGGCWTQKSSRSVAHATGRISSTLSFSSLLRRGMEMECVPAFETEKGSWVCAEAGVRRRHGIIDSRRLLISIV